MLRTRTSIAGMMGVVLVAAVGMAALRSESYPWASGVFCLTCGMLIFGLVGAACDRGPGRTWWTGFAFFGWGYLLLAFWPWNGSFQWPVLPTIPLLAHVLADLGVRQRPQSGDTPFLSEYTFGPFPQIAHSLWSLVFAMFGGMLARLVFAGPTGTARPDHSERAQPAAGSMSRKWWRRPTVIAAGILVLYTLAALAGLRTAPSLWAGATVLITWGLFALAAVGTVFGRREHRARWFGAVLFGAGYLILISATGEEEQTWPQFSSNRLLDAIRPRFLSTVTEHPAASASVAYSNARVLKALDRPVPMHFPKDTPLKDVLAYIVAETRGPNGEELPIYVDPVGLAEFEKTIESPVSIVMDRVPLRRTLKLLLQQLGLTYYLDDGLIEITSTRPYQEEVDPGYYDPYLLVGQRILALLAAGLGSVLAPLVCRPETT